MKSAFASEGALDALTSFGGKGRQRGILMAAEAVGMAADDVSEEKQVLAIPRAQFAKEEVEPHCDTLPQWKWLVQGLRD